MIYEINCWISCAKSIAYSTTKLPVLMVSKALTPQPQPLEVLRKSISVKLLWVENFRPVDGQFVFPPILNDPVDTILLAEAKLVALIDGVAQPDPQLGELGVGELESPHRTWAAAISITFGVLI